MVDRREYCKKYRLEHKEERKEQWKKYYLGHKKERREYRRRYREETYGWFSELKISIGCAICGYNRYGGALDFHHVNGEDKEISGKRLRNMYYGKQRYFDEFHKCILLCKNCHAEVTLDKGKVDETKDI